jgi:hypothetical protein
MRTFKIIKGTFLLVLILLIIIPSWINYLDTGEESITIDELLKGNRNLKTSNLRITGKALFEFSCRYEDRSKEGRLENVLYYIPIVPIKWTKDQEIKAILILDSGKRDWDIDFDSATKSLEQKMDSLKSIKGNIQIKVTYHKYDFFKFEDEPINCLKNQHSLKLADNSDIQKLVFNEKHSLFGKIFVSLLAVALAIIIFIKIK